MNRLALERLDDGDEPDDEKPQEQEQVNRQENPANEWHKGQHNARTIQATIQATARKIDCHAWNLTFGFVLYGATIRKMIAGMTVR